MDVTFLEAFDSGNIAGEELHVGAGETVELSEAQFAALVRELGWPNARARLWVADENGGPWSPPTES